MTAAENPQKTLAGPWELVIHEHKKTTDSWELNKEEPLYFANRVELDRYLLQRASECWNRKNDDYVIGIISHSIFGVRIADPYIAHTRRLDYELKRKSGLLT